MVAERFVLRIVGGTGLDVSLTGEEKPAHALRADVAMWTREWWAERGFEKYFEWRWDSSKSWRRFSLTKPFVIDEYRLQTGYIL